MLLFVALWFFSRTPRPLRSVSGLFLLGYGIMRFGVEFVREPDAHIGYLAFGWFTMGQALTLPMLVAGLVLLIWAYRHPADPVAVPPPEPEPRARSSRRRPRRRRG